MKQIRFAAPLALILVIAAHTTGGALSTTTAQEDALRAVLGNMNETLAAQGVDYRIEVVEWFTDPTSGNMGNTVFFSDRGNKQTPFHFVPADPRRGGFVDISYLTDAVDGTTSSGLTLADTTAAIERGMATWQAQRCSDIPLTNLGTAPFDVGVVQFLLGFGGLPLVFADVSHAGFLPASFFDQVLPGGGSFILGATFTFQFIGGTDINNDGKIDAAFREIYYNDAFPWNIDANFDLETVALHEAGHGLSQAHFGKAFLSNGNGKLHFAPRAVMNASYSGVQQALRGTDNGGHCSIWGSWPNQ